jgi:hypothetical protein
MTKRVVAPVIGVTPQAIADYYHVKVGGITNSYVDYYVTARDMYGNTYNSPIQHVHVGVGQSSSSGGGGNGCNGRVCVSPSPPTNNTSVTIQYYPSGGPIPSASAYYIHLGWNNWGTVVSPDAAMSFKLRLQSLGIQRYRSFNRQPT